MKVGYARVSTEEQCLDLQLSALKAAGCDTILSDHGISGTRFDRPGLLEALRVVKQGDALIVWRLDRLGRSLSHLVEAVRDLGGRGVEFVSLTDSIDTRSSTGMLMFHMMAALAEFERTIISERTRAGILAARARGAKIGSPRKTQPDLVGKLHVLSASVAVSDTDHIACLYCGQAFLRLDLLPGHDNPVSCRHRFPPDSLACLGDTIRRSRRRSDAGRVGRRSRYLSVVEPDGRGIAQ